MSALLSVAPTVAFTILLTQCTPYLPLIPTVVPATFINPSPPPSTRCPNLPPQSRQPKVWALHPTLHRHPHALTGGAMYMASAGPVRRRCPPGYLHAHPLSLRSPGAYHACTGLSNDARLARAQPSGDLHAAQI